MDIEYTIEDIEGDTISFKVLAGSDVVEISIPHNKETMSSSVAIVSLDTQDIARLVEKLDLPEVTYE